MKKPKILILDDSTSAVDTKTDAMIRKAFREEIPDTTKFIIAQRISSVQDADKIVVMDGGKILDVGTHEELLGNSSIYREVYESQSKGGRRMNKELNKKNPGQGMRRVNKKVVQRLLSYIGQYKLRFTCVLVCIFLSALTSVASSLYLQTLIDDYIAPLLLQASPVFAGLLRSLVVMGSIYLGGVAATLLYNRLMVVIAQGILKDIRDEMFARMQTLPIRYFDTHTHGDIMSHYTNDTDTLRQMMAQSIPQMFSSLITILSVFCAMLATSWQLTIFVLFFVFLMLKVTGKIAGKSGHYFVRQQQALGDLNGYIEEMINGQKVIKVFCHEESAEEVFDQKNEILHEDAAAANTFANILMPVMSNLGNLQYVLIAMLGGPWRSQEWED